MEQQATDTRGTILKVGRRLMAQHGFTGVGLGELLGTAGVPKGSFYHYFPSKEAYGCALLQTFVDDYAEVLEDTLDRTDLDARARILRYFETWHRNQTSPDPEDRCLVVRLSAEVADLSEGMSRILEGGVEAIVSKLAATLAEGMAEGSIAQVDEPRALAEALYHQWLGASLVASLSHSDAALTAAFARTEAILTPR